MWVARGGTGGLGGTVAWVARWLGWHAQNEVMGVVSRERKATKDLKKKVVRLVLCATGSASAESLVHVALRALAKPVAPEARLAAAT